MRYVQKQKVLDFIGSLHQAHEEIKKALEEKNAESVPKMLDECQQFAYELGDFIEKQEGEGHITISLLEEYCEVLFQIYRETANVWPNAAKVYKRLKKQMLKVESSAKNDITARKEIAFFPYKASMWDSLESVYFAAKEDLNCDVYCVPIPYYDINPDRSLGKFHYEGDQYPPDIEVIDWQSYHFEEREPDVIYIHNPYDDWNYVTSVHPRYYSENLKKYTKTLVYIPYYSTSGGMSEGQRLCPVYFHADYIVIQSPKLRKYFDERIPEDKFLQLGSPKFDKIIKKCKNPEIPYTEWREKIAGKKIYFYNTSLNGMLADTESFLKKIRYVFSCFEGREDVCLLWRPHPLMEATFSSMRIQYKEEYLSLKREFIAKGLGIYDTSPDATDAVAMSDVYIGDAGSSLTSLFGIAGKPIFILDNRLHSAPDEESWRGEIKVGFNYRAEDRFVIAQGNKLYVSEPFAYDYRYLCDLPEDMYDGNYGTVYEIDKKFYVCPRAKQDILIIDENGDQKKIELEQVEGITEAFNWAVRYGKYIILMPDKYPAIVRYDTAIGEIKYISDDVDVIIEMNSGIAKIGGNVIRNGKIYMSSPTDGKIFSFDIETMEHTITMLPVRSGCGYKVMWSFQGWIWMLSCGGERMEIVRWNPDTDEVRVYDQFPEKFKCINSASPTEQFSHPFSNGTFYGNYLYLAPFHANMYIKLDMITGEMTEWLPGFVKNVKEKYPYSSSKSLFLWKTSDAMGKVKIFSYPDRKLYEINPETDEYREIIIRFDIDELKEHEKGFCYYSENLRYCCRENSFNSVDNLLDGDMAGTPFDKEKQMEVYREIISNADGTCGAKVHEFVSKL